MSKLFVLILYFFIFQLAYANPFGYSNTPQRRSSNNSSEDFNELNKNLQKVEKQISILQRELKNLKRKVKPVISQTQGLMAQAREMNHILGSEVSNRSRYPKLNLIKLDHYRNYTSDSNMSHSANQLQNFVNELEKSLTEFYNFATNKKKDYRKTRNAYWDAKKIHDKAYSEHAKDKWKESNRLRESISSPPKRRYHGGPSF